MEVGTNRWRCGNEFLRNCRAIGGCNNCTFCGRMEDEDDENGCGCGERRERNCEERLERELEECRRRECERRRGCQNRCGCR